MGPRRGTLAAVMRGAPDRCAILVAALRSACHSHTPQVADEKNGAAVFAVLRFSLDGKYLLAVVEGRIYVMDAFEGTVERKVCGVVGSSRLAMRKGAAWAEGTAVQMQAMAVPDRARVSSLGP